MTIKDLHELLEKLIPILGEDAAINLRDENGDPFPLESACWSAEPGKLVLG